MSGQHKNITGYSASDIEKYRKGELSAREMHELERAALEDPFLADALEGMELHSSLHQPAGTGWSDGEPAVSGWDRDLEELRGRLQSRVAGKADKKAILYRRIWIRWAAAVILFIGAGSVTWYSLLSKSKLTPSRASAVMEARRKTGSAEPPLATQQAQPSSATADSTALAPDNRTALNEKTAPAPATGVTIPTTVARSSAPLARRHPIPGNDASSIATIPSATDKAPATATSDAETTFSNPDSMALAKKMAVSLQMITTRGKLTAKDSAANIAMKMNRSLSNNGVGNNAIGNNAFSNNQYKNSRSASNTLAFSGQVLDEHNRPLAGASVYLSGHSNINTVTNRYGQFNLNNLDLVQPDSALKVMVAHIGYEQTSIALNTRDVLDNDNAMGNIIRLQPQNLSLDEVIVTGYGTQRKETLSPMSTGNIDSLWIKASPVTGRLAYISYLAIASKQLALDSTIKGAEIISFDVNKKGELSSFKVEQSLSPAHDSGTIRLIRQGPPWKLLRGREVRTSVRVNY